MKYMKPFLWSIFIDIKCCAHDNSSMKTMLSCLTGMVCVTFYRFVF